MQTFSYKIPSAHQSLFDMLCTIAIKATVETTEKRDG